MIKFSCPSCGKQFRVKDSLGGKSATCKCGKSLEIPASDDGFTMEYVEPERTMTPLAIGLMAGVIVSALILAVFFLKRYGAYKTHAEYINTLNLFTDAKSDFKHGDYEKALEKIEAVIEIRPTWGAPYLQGGVACIRLEQWEQATDFFEKISTLSDTPRDYLTCANVNLGYLELRKDDPDEFKAQSYLKEAVDLTPSAAVPHLMLAALAVNSGNLSEAKGHLIQVEQDMAKLPKEGMSLYTLLKMRMAGEADDADAFIQQYQEAKKHKQPESFPNEATFTALRLLTENEAFDPENDNDLLDLAQTALERADDKEKASLQTMFGKLMFSAGNYAEAVKRLEPVIDEHAPPDLISLLAEVHARLADASEDKITQDNHLEQTLAMYLRLLSDPVEVKQRGAGIMTSTIALCDRLGKVDKASELLGKALALYPDNARLHLRKARILFRQKQYAEGLVAMEKCLSLDPTQDALRTEFEGYRGEPTFDDFRPSKLNDFVPRPLIHVRINTGSPFPIDAESVKLTINGKRVNHALGGNEVFYVPPKELSVGKHVVHITAADEVGNAAEASFRVPIDGSPPKAELVQPDGTVQQGQPEFKLRLFDKMTMVDPASVSVMLRSGQGNRNFLSMTLLTNGVYRQDSEEYNFKRGDRLSDPESIRFRPSKRLYSGQYEIHIQMKDVAGFDTREVLRFTVE